ncbi:hypothetical protein Ccrd_019868 [Cynara cardunculus var. scolymus]|uniref:Uncharacterized protein n=1 Tax=Cynara cardunculus var. scolymus TaxID=59895 RepID=A0A103Y3H3_CYNCS|nr:hypothetical protein Ccrd_019868 [Cynara cardunculus var. scolymus]
MEKQLMKLQFALKNPCCRCLLDDSFWKPYNKEMEMSDYDATTLYSMGFLPQAISNATTPKLNTSDSLLAFPVTTHSGAISERDTSEIAYGDTYMITYGISVKISWIPIVLISIKLHCNKSIHCENGACIDRKPYGSTTCDHRIILSKEEREAITKDQRLWGYAFIHKAIHKTWLRPSTTTN